MKWNWVFSNHCPVQVFRLTYIVSERSLVSSKLHFHIFNKPPVFRTGMQIQIGRTRLFEVVDGRLIILDKCIGLFESWFLGDTMCHCEVEIDYKRAINNILWVILPSGGCMKATYLINMIHCINSALSSYKENSYCCSIGCDH